MGLHLTMGENGRLVIPAAVRDQIGLPGGGRVVVSVREGAIVVEPLDAAIRRVQATVQQYVPEGVSLSEEVIADRRAEAARES